MGSHTSDWAWSSDPALLANLTRKGWRPNFLVHCAPHEIHEVAKQLTRACVGPVHPCVLPGRLELPAQPAGTLLLARVEELTMAQQVELFDWISTWQGRVQLASIATTRLERLVAHGRFLEGLFYRLNVVYLEARSPRIVAVSCGVRL
jgi:hypothetical protein